MLDSIPKMMLEAIFAFEYLRIEYIHYYTNITISWSYNMIFKSLLCRKKIAIENFVFKEIYKENDLIYPSNARCIMVMYPFNKTQCPIWQLVSCSQGVSTAALVTIHDRSKPKLLKKSIYPSQ